MTCRFNCDDDGIVWGTDNNGRRHPMRCRCPKAAKQPEGWVQHAGTPHERRIPFPLVPLPPRDEPIGRERAAGRDD